MPYCFTSHLYPGVPKLNLHPIEASKSFHINEIEILPIEVMHGALPILGFRIGDFAYITDMKTIHEDSFKLLKGVQTLVVNALRWEKEHHSHMLVSEGLRVLISLTSPILSVFMMRLTNFCLKTLSLHTMDCKLICEKK